MELRGGLMYAGVDGYPTRQGQPLNDVAPRGRLRLVGDGEDGDSRRLRPLLGAADQRHRRIGDRRARLLGVDDIPVEHRRRPDAGGHDFESVPGRYQPPQGNSLGLATGAGSVIDFVDQDSKPGYVQQYSLDWQRELPGQMAIAFGYMGSRSERLSLGGTSDTTININQLDPQYMALGTALQQTVPNPFFGIPRSAT